MNWIDKAEKELSDALDRGEISPQEFNREMRELQRDVRAEAEEAAEGAYNDVMNNYI